MARLLLREITDWKGAPFTSEFYKYEPEAKSLSPVTQVQCVSFLKSGKVVLYKHIDGYYGLPGGKGSGE